MSQLHQTNAFLQYHKPWELRKNSAEQPWLNTILALSFNTLRVCGILLSPVTPEIASKLLDRLNVHQSHRNCINLRSNLDSSVEQSLGQMDGVLFPRIKIWYHILILYWFVFFAFITCDFYLFSEVDELLYNITLKTRKNRKISLEQKVVTQYRLSITSDAYDHRHIYRKSEWTLNWLC